MGTITKVTTYTIKLGSDVQGNTYNLDGGTLIFTVASSPSSPSKYLITGVSGTILGNTIASIITPSALITNLLNIDKPNQGFLDFQTPETNDIIGFKDTNGKIYALQNRGDATDTMLILYVDITGTNTTKIYNDFPSLPARYDGVQAYVTESIQGSDSVDSITGSEQAESIYAFAGNDTIAALGGNDNLYGGNGNDTLTGGKGNDFIDGGSDKDTVRFYDSAASYNISYDAATLTFTTTHSLVGSYDDGTDHIINSEIFNFADTTNKGKSKATVNVLTNGNTAATLTGTTTQDWIYSGSGNDTIDGKAGADKMMGGAGNDTYYIDSIQDIVVENANEGTNDFVISSVSYTLGNNLEGLQLSGVGNINGSGNALNNFIFGTKGKNVINGYGGNDEMFGHAGNDTYYVDSYDYQPYASCGDMAREDLNNGTDTVIYSASSDFFKIYDNVENFTMAGTHSIEVLGNSENNVIVGGTNNDLIIGGAGKDTLTGGLGNDTFIFQNLTDSNAANRDTIKDFVSGTDKIVLQFSISGFDQVTSIATKLTLGQVAFSANKLSIDTNGDKVADFEITLTGVKSILPSDIQITAPT